MYNQKRFLSLLFDDNLQPAPQLLIFRSLKRAGRFARGKFTGIRLPYLAPCGPVFAFAHTCF